MQDLNIPLTQSRFQSLSAKYRKLRIAVLGDFCLDRYLEIDPRKKEISIETGLTVHNVVQVRSQPGGAGTILNNLNALGIEAIYPIGFTGRDGEGWELQQALNGLSSVKLDCFLETSFRRTFTYTKPLSLQRGKPPRELNRLDMKNWTPTPRSVEASLVSSLQKIFGEIDALVILDQVDLPNTGAVTGTVLRALKQLIKKNPTPLVLADSRRGLKDYPPLILKMNRSELFTLTKGKKTLDPGKIRSMAGSLARKNQKSAFVTLAEDGIVAADASGNTFHQTALPLRGSIDIVGAGDAVTANLTAALAAGGEVEEATILANTAASIVIHKLGTTGTATVKEIQKLLFGK